MDENTIPSTPPPETPLQKPNPFFSFFQKNKMFILASAIVILLAASVIYVQSAQKVTSPPKKTPTPTKAITPTLTPTATATPTATLMQSGPTKPMTTPTPAKTGILGFIVSESKILKDIKRGECTFALNVTSTSSTDFHLDPASYWKHGISWKPASGHMQKGETVPVEMCVDKEPKFVAPDIKFTGAGDRTTFHDDTTGAIWGLFVGIAVKE